MKTRGFTIVEILIVLVIMGVLLTLAVVGTSLSQRNARDNERKLDIETIAQSLENSLRQEKTIDGITVRAGTYPGTSAMNAAISNNSIEQFLGGISPASLRAPGIPNDSEISLVMATNATQTPEGVEPDFDATTYLYQPIDQNGLCANNCRSFNLYYRTEGSNEVNIVRSRQQ